MSGPIYSFVRLFLATLYPAYYSFKAVKTKNVKEYVKWMMYWIIYAFFIAFESVMDPFLIFWLPFYSEVKMVLLLYLVAPATRGSGVIYRRWLHPFLCDKEEEIDAVLQRVKEQGTNTAMTWIHQGVQWLGGVIVRGAVKGGGGLMQQLKRSYSLTDLGEHQQFDQHRFTDVTEEEEGGYFSPGMRRRQQRGQHPNHPLMARSPDRYLSNESLSSGYNTDFFPGPGGEPMETGDYELWAPNRVPSPSSPTPPPPPLQMASPPHLVPGGMAFPPGSLPPSGGVGISNPQLSSSAPNTIFSPVYAPRQKAKGRTRPAQEQGSDDDEETFFDSETLPTPFGVARPGQLTSPSSSCCPSDRESLAGDYSDREEEGWGGRTPTFHPSHSPYYCPPSDGDVTPTRCPSPLPQPPLRKPREATGTRAQKGTGEEERAEQDGESEKLMREDKVKETDEEQRGPTEKDQSYCENKEISSKEESQKNEEMQRNEELANKKEMSIKEELQKKEKERSIREERERDKRILKEIEERERERQVREKQRIAEETERLKEEKEKERLKEKEEKERMKEEKEKERLREEEEKERLKEEKEKERLKEEREEKEREEERKAIVARAKKEAKEQRKSWAEEKSMMSAAKGLTVSGDLEADELKSKDDQYLQKEIEDAIQNEDTGFVDNKKTTDSSCPPTQACQIPTAFQSGKEPGQTSKKVDDDESEHIYEDIDDLRTRTSQMKLRQLEEASKDETGSDDSLSKPKSGKKSRAPLPPGISSSFSSSLSSSPGVSSFLGSNSNLVQPEERIRHLTPVRMLEEEDKKEEEDGQVFYRSPGYPAPHRSRSITQISTSVPTLPPDQPIKEKVTPFTGTEEVEEEERFVRRRREEVPTSPSPTRIFTSSGGITRLRTYSPPPVDETSSALTPSSPGLLPRSETLPRCPHCTIHAWLPHSPGCPNKSK